jgi:thiol-disulfide isomerase/thioredoxin
MNFFKQFEKHLKGLFEGKNVMRNLMFVVVTCVVVWFVVDMLSKAAKEGFGALGSDTYEGTSGKTLGFFHMNECGHCKKFMPEWDKFAAGNKGPIGHKKIEAGDDHPWLKKFGIQGFPTVLLIDGDEKVATYEGPRTAQGLSDFCQENA